MTENQLHVKPKLKFMIRKKLMMAVAMTAATFFSSCTEEHDLGGDLLSKQTIVAEMAEMSDAPQSRTCVDVKNPSTSFVGLLWQVADKLGVFNQNGTENAQFSNNGTETAPKADFSGELSGTATYAYFPYSADNAGRSASSLLGKILAEQPFDPENGSLVCDYKVGKATTTEDGKTKFTFTQLMTMLRITLDASETALEGERLNNIILTVTDKDGNKRNICGEFTFNATNGEVGTTITNPSNSVSMPWTTRPTLAKGKSYQGFISILPNIVKAEDNLNIEVISEGHRATFTANCVSDLLKGYIYNIPLKLKEFLDKFNGKVEELTQPTINSFKFEYSKNTGKLLEKKLTWSSKKPSASTATYEATVSNNEITLTIPYLYDFKLKPTITFTGSTVKVNGADFTSGETEVDFTRPVIFTVYAKDGGSQDYTVKITNSGLPVVVVTMSGSGDYDKKYKGGFEMFGQIVGGTLLNDFVDMYVRGKDTEWVEDDNITVYNPDGTVDCSGLCGVRLRGNTTQTYPKKPFAIKLKEKTSVLGMPKHKRWVLLANQLDHSMIRNAVALDIAHAVEYAWRENSAIGEGIPWCPSGQHVELVVISQKYNKAYHVGNYFLAEQIKIDGERLDIKDPFDIEEPGASDFTQYGFLIEAVNKEKCDETSYFKSSNGIYFQFKDELNTTILNQVKAKIQRIEDNIDNEKYTDAYTELDINSMIDQMLIWELTLNREYGDPSSVYMYMDGDGKLSAGPVWDFDRGTFQNQENAKTYGNSDRVKSDNQWMYWRKATYTSEPYIWYPKLSEDPTFQQTVQKRWEVIYPYLNELIENQIRTYGESLKVSWESNNGIWPSNKTAIRSFKSDFKDWSGDEELSSFEEVISNFVEVYNQRLAGMNKLITEGTFTK